ncbi:DUF2306 domain-containing protein [Massilia glaciei]|uniref:DUF2306 domain-containing protein n=1 Tax=Massilia glaciei TaxID=1524097 RepID=A0A2U2HJG2_9BURK|nr:DUF2306 domain-containing protein [Massilia glaciei]PWF47582.1 DUF2306 domain-containing protein [Massilia glaciei]
MTFGSTTQAGLAQQQHGATTTSARRRSLQDFAGTALKAAAAFWLAVTAIGQLIFVVYIVALYGRSTVQGNFAAWNKVMPHGYVPGDSIGNAALAGHMLLAAIIMLGGLLQLVPQLRTRAPAFHRWNGRVYLLSAVAASLTGLYMVWFRGAAGDLMQHLGISFNALLVVVCGAMALRHALARKFALHRRWALRLFLVVSGVWFFRVGLMFWIVVNGGPAGFDPETFRGPFLSFLSFAQTLLPLAVLELYLRAQDRAGAGGKIAMAAGLLALTLAMGVGIGVATMGLWLPHI